MIFPEQPTNSDYFLIEFSNQETQTVTAPRLGTNITSRIVNSRGSRALELGDSRFATVLIFIIVSTVKSEPPTSIDGHKSIELDSELGRVECSVCFKFKLLHV